MSLSLAVSGRILTSDPSRRRTSSGYRLTGPTDRRGSVLLLAEALPRPLDLLLGVLAAVPAADLGLLLLEVLVDREEVGDLVGQLLGQVAELLERVPGGIGQRHAQDLVVDALLVRQLEQRDRLDLDHAAGERRLGDAHHRVELVAVLSQRLGKVAVVGRVDDRGVQEAIELDGAELLVPLVLVAAPLGDLDEAEELGVVAHGAPRVLGRAISLGRCGGPSFSPCSPRSGCCSPSPRPRSRRAPTTARAGSARPTTGSSPSSRSAWSPSSRSSSRCSACSRRRSTAARSVARPRRCAGAPAGSAARRRRSGPLRAPRRGVGGGN